MHQLHALVAAAARRLPSLTPGQFSVRSSALLRCPSTSSYHQVVTTCNPHGQSNEKRLRKFALLVSAAAAALTHQCSSSLCAPNDDEPAQASGTHSHGSDHQPQVDTIPHDQNFPHLDVTLTPDDWSAACEAVPWNKAMLHRFKDGSWLDRVVSGTSPDGPPLTLSYQKEALVHVLKKFAQAVPVQDDTEKRSPATPVAVQLPTGAGKSRIIWAVAAACSLTDQKRPKDDIQPEMPKGKACRTLILTPSRAIRTGMEDTWKDLTEPIGLNPADTDEILHLDPDAGENHTERDMHRGMPPQPHGPYCRAGVVVTTYQYMSKLIDKAYKTFKQAGNSQEGIPGDLALLEFQQNHGFDVVIIDEGHHYLAATYEKTVAFFRPSKIFLLSADFRRQDGKTIPRQLVFSRSINWAEERNVIKQTIRHRVCLKDVNLIVEQADRDPVQYNNILKHLEALDSAQDDSDLPACPTDMESLVQGGNNDKGKPDNEDSLPKSEAGKLRRLLEDNLRFQVEMVETVLNAVRQVRNVTRRGANPTDNPVPVTALCITRSKAHCKWICEIFKRLGAQAEYVLSDSVKRSDNVMKKLESGNVEVLVVRSMLLEGFDWPLIGVTAFFTALSDSATQKAYQFIGRAMRWIVATSDKHRDLLGGRTQAQLDSSGIQMAHAIYPKCFATGALLERLGFNDEEQCYPSKHQQPQQQTTPLLKRRKMGEHNDVEKEMMLHTDDMCVGMDCLQRVGSTPVTHSLGDLLHRKPDIDLTELKMEVERLMAAERISMKQTQQLAQAKLSTLLIGVNDEFVKLARAGPAAGS